MVNPRVFMDISIAGKSAGRIVIELFADTTPQTAAKFRTVCTGENPGRLHYKGSKFWCATPDFLKGGECGSINDQKAFYGLNTKPENLIRKHDAPGIVSMIERNGPQFAITLVELPGYDDNSYNSAQVVIGKVVEGLDIVKSVANKPPWSPAVITDCGELKEFPPNISSFDQLASTSNKQLSNCLKEIMNVNKQLIAADPKAVLTPENEKELVKSSEIFQRNLDVLSDLKVEVCSLEKRQKELLCQTVTEISFVKKRKHVVEMISSLSYNDLVNIENVMKKSKTDC